MQGENFNIHMILAGKPEAKWPLGRPTLRLEDNIKVYLR
jgi:hypothetical protein